MIWLFGLAACAPEGDLDPQRLRAPAPLLLRFPIAERALILDRVMGIDHDPTEYQGVEDIFCTNYAGDGFPYCYDSHDGTDFDLIDGFATMDAGSATVVAAAPGTVERVVDIHYDRCHLDPETLGPDCDGYEMAANVVVLRHSGGARTIYAHLAQYSALVSKGDEVERGEPLGLVGSSGYSTAPHLHLELLSEDGTSIDPYAGPYSQEASYWCEQEAGDGLPGDGC